MKREKEAKTAAALTYFSLFGISEDASQDEIEARYRDLAEYLASPAIPAHLRDWANQQAAVAEEAYAVLTDPEGREAARRGLVPAPAPSAPAVPPIAERSERPRRRAVENRGADFPDEYVESDSHPDAPGRRRSSPPAAGRPQGRSGRRSRVLPQRLALGAVLGLAVLGAVLLGRYGLPGTGGSEATPTADETGLVPLDEKRIAELMASAQEDPNNPETLFELGESFFQAGEWQAAIDWFTKLVAIDPNNVHAHTDIGTANFNLGSYEEAKAAWLAALEVDSNDVQVHYNLGFLYANVEPQDLAAARKEWQKVVELAPGSDLAQTAQVHLEGLADASPGASPAPSPAASPAASPGAP